MKGRVFEKVGVNVSTVSGRFAPDFAATIPGASEDPRFFATGISLVAHMANPHVPAVHMNCRFLVTTKRWFGGGADLNPPLPYEEDTTDFHAAFRDACEAHPGAGDYPRFKQWADDYFWIPHRKTHRGVGGIFFDQMEGDFETNFAFVRDVGEAFLDVFPRIARRRMNQPWDEADRGALLAYRGRYAEFNLVYDRGTLFGLKTGHDVDAILMSLPPLAAWN
jgi:coproporphyrinogen III oxidase